MPTLTVSTIIPTYNRSGLVARAVRSALRDVRLGDEIIVADDGSTDDTKTLVEAFGSPVRYLRLEHRGQSAALNAAVAHAKGDLVALLDSDDEWMPGKLAWQRTILEQFPEILFLFSDFSHVTPSGDRIPHQISTWHSDTRSWDEILGPGIESSLIAGLPASAPPFKLHIGSLYRGLAFHFYVCTSTFIVRRERAGDALTFSEDLPMFGDYECFARLASRGPGAYMDCDTEWNHGHSGDRLTDNDQITRSDALIKITERIWGRDTEYLRLHHAEYEAALDRRRLRKVRSLLSEGRRAEARAEVKRCYHPPTAYGPLTLMPGSVTALATKARRRLRNSS
jgi:glycosyltransferase involved in cell wall biosynthesis